MVYNWQKKNEEKIFFHDIGMLCPLYALGLLHTLLQQQQ